ncbi:MAG: hypothetical protein ACRC46_05305 [Thermoguttaceae bacterium]
MLVSLKKFVCVVLLVVCGSVLAADDAGTAEVYKGKGPCDIKASRDGATLYVANTDSSEVLVIATANDAIVQTIPVGNRPSGLAVSSDGKSLFVTSGVERGVLQRIDLETGKVAGEVAVGHSPCSPVVAPDGSRIFVCNRYLGEVAEYALPAMTLTRRIPTGREPKMSVITPDGKTLFVAHFLPDDPNNVPDNPEATIDVACEIAAIDIATGDIKRIRLVNGSHSLHGLAITPDGKHLFATQILARFQLPTTQLDRGWVNTNGLSIIDAEKKELINTVLLDDIVLGAANPWSVTVSPDGKRVYVTIAGTHELCVLELEPILAKLNKVASDPSLQATTNVPDELSFLVGMKKRIKLKGNGARSVIAAGDAVYVGMYFSDTLQKVVIADAGPPKVVEVPLGPPPVLTAARRGEINWNDATPCFQSWLSCASCHPDARTDGLNWDLLNDGLGSPKNAKSMVLTRQTPPAMWTGVREHSDLAIRTGYRFILFSVPDEKKCTDIEAYYDSLVPVPSPHLVDGKLSESAERGKVLFESERVNCAKCHPAPLYTDRQMHNVGTRVSYDKIEPDVNKKREKAGLPPIDPKTFDTPTLVECWRTAPYFHDGRYPHMKQVFAEGRHGLPDTITEAEIDDIVEYVMSL